MKVDAVQFLTSSTNKVRIIEMMRTKACSFTRLS